jgi:hypothetical protein
MTFKELKFRTHAENDIQAWTEINGYEVSIIRNALSHGGDKGLYEIGVYKGGTNEMCDPLGWGDDVKGWLTPEDVEKELELIKAL